MSLNHRTKLQGYTYSIPAKSLLGEHWELQGKGGKVRKGSLVNCMGERAREMGVKDKSMDPVVCWPPVPPRLLPEPDVDFSILDRLKKKDAGEPESLVSGYLRE